MEIVSGKAPKELDEKKQAKAEKQYQAMQKRAERRKGKGKPSYWEMKIDYIALREAKNPELRRMLEPMAVTPEPPTP